MTLKWLVDSKHGHFMWPLDVNKPTTTKKIKIAYFDQCFGCAAPKRWLKYTSSVYLKTILKLHGVVRKEDKFAQGMKKEKSVCNLKDKNSP